MVTVTKEYLESLERHIFDLNDYIEDAEKFLKEGDIERAKAYVNTCKRISARYLECIFDNRRNRTKGYKGYNVSVTKKPVRKPATRKVKRA